MTTTSMGGTSITETGGIGSDVDWALVKLRELRAQFAESEGQLLEIERRCVHLQDAMLRLSGAIHVLEELVAASGMFASTREGADPLSGHGG